MRLILNFSEHPKGIAMVQWGCGNRSSKIHHENSFLDQNSKIEFLSTHMAIMGRHSLDKKLVFCQHNYKILTLTFSEHLNILKTVQWAQRIVLLKVNTQSKFCTQMKNLNFWKNKNISNFQKFGKSKSELLTHAKNASKRYIKTKWLWIIKLD